MIPRTNYLLFLDECGTHDMENVDPTFPVFVLVGRLVGEKYYAKTLAPLVKKLKRRHLDNPNAILHSREIRRLEGDFSCLRSMSRKNAFYSELNKLIESSRIRIFAVAIDKRRLLERFLFPVNPYDVSLSQLLSLVCGPPGKPGPNKPTVVRIIAESRGKREDKGLQKEYQSFHRSGLWNYKAPGVQNRRASTVQRFFPNKIVFARKSRIIAGLELADIAAYPIGRAVVNQNWDNPAFKIILQKIKGLVFFS